MKNSMAQVLLRLFPAALMVAAFAAIGVMHVMSRVEVVDSGYRLSQLEQRSQALSLENDRLKLELATLKSPARLERVARDQLGMGAPPSSAVLTVTSPHRPLARAGRVR
jgi:cell division protein FtsL